ncbi:TM2 domain-containing protein almondex-like isoform X4 [Rhynchophorus ferrugineus]|uniref:TM2 domain-containing protein almondex-like isoform X4 n=1 Tax=Rhynchophorus ferrugineus TaxID=354439 RepID=UPI003FCDA01F
MRCIHINIRKATFILLTFLANNIRTADNQIPLSNEEFKKSNNTKETSLTNNIMNCPLNMECKELSIQCLDCKLNENCTYGQEVTAECQIKSQVKCKGDTKFLKSHICRYCYQTENWEHECELKATCESVASPRDIYITNCTVKNNLLCLGHRTFNKKVKCNWTGGYKWLTALILSITLGGFGADRFYLGHWQEGIGKLFSFGGLGVWTIIDVVLISLHYLGPADGSLYL